MISSPKATNSNVILSSEQFRNVAFMWGTYAAFYLGRLNLSPALPDIAKTLDIGLGEVGILGNVFFWCYALGQIINGQLGSILRPHWVILPGLLLVAIVNIGFAFQSSLIFMAILWGINGFAQSMGWGPMLHILSSHTTKPQKRRLATVFSMSFQVGTAISWGLAVVLISWGGFRLAFLIPGLLLLMVAFVWWLVGLDAERITTERNVTTLNDIVDDIRCLFPMLLIASSIGFIYIGFLIWLPTFVQSWAFLETNLAGLLTAIIPLVGIPGMYLSGRLLSRQANLAHTTTQLLVGLLIALIISGTTSNFVQMIAIMSAVMFASGLAGILLSASPMLLVSSQRVSSAGGLLTAVWSIAGGLAGTTVGTLADNHGWTMVFNLWIATTVIAIIIVLITSGRIQNQVRSQGEG